MDEWWVVGRPGVAPGRVRRRRLYRPPRLSSGLPPQGGRFGRGARGAGPGEGFRRGRNAPKTAKGHRVFPWWPLRRSVEKLELRREDPRGRILADEAETFEASAGLGTVPPHRGCQGDVPGRREASPHARGGARGGEVIWAGIHHGGGSDVRRWGSVPDFRFFFADRRARVWGAASARVIFV